MSNFLNELNNNAKTKREYLVYQEQTEKERQREHEREVEQKHHEEKAYFEDVMRSFCQKIKNTCVEAVKEACFVNFNNKRYILCEIAFIQAHRYEGGEWGIGDSDSFYLHFRCYMMERNSIIKSKRVYNVKSINIPVDASKVGCERGEGGLYWHLPEHVRSVISEQTKENIDGYVEKKDLPVKVFELNYPGYLDGPQLGYRCFDRSVSTHSFAIEF